MNEYNVGDLISDFLFENDLKTVFGVVSVHNIPILDAIAKRNLIKSEKDELERKNQEILREHKYLTERVKKLEHELKLKRDLEKKFNKDIDDLNQETQDLVDEIEKWQT